MTVMHNSLLIHVGLKCTNRIHAIDNIVIKLYIYICQDSSSQKWKGPRLIPEGLRATISRTFLPTGRKDVFKYFNVY